MVKIIKKLLVKHDFYLSPLIVHLTRIGGDELTKEIIQTTLDGNYLPLVIYKPLKSLWWIAKHAYLDFYQLQKALEILNQPRHWVFGVPYKETYRRKKDGGKRYIYEPCEPLMRVQRGINRHILKKLPRHPNVFGFSGGGGVKEAIKPHFGSQTMLTLDIRDAFSNTSAEKVYAALDTALNQTRDLPKAAITVLTQLTTFTLTLEIELSHQLMTLMDSNAITVRALPQGAPTSPRIFDLVCQRMDRRLAKLAHNVNGIYTRYADNIFFSMPIPETPPKILRAITRIIRKEGYTPHKIREANLKNKKVRALGLNIIDGELHNTRGFKRRLRLTIHHLGWLKDNEQNATETEKILRGQMSWAQTDTLPSKLRAKLREQ